MHTHLSEGRASEYPWDTCAQSTPPTPGPIHNAYNEYADGVADADADASDAVVVDSSGLQRE